MHCNQEQIEALLDGELVGPEQDAVLAHLRDCPGCRSYYRQLLAMEQALRADTDPVPEDLLPDIMNRVHTTSQRRRRQPWLRTVMGMAACLVVVLGIYYKLQTFLYLPANGIVQGMRPLVGYNYGAREHGRVSRLYNLTLGLSAGIMAIGTLLCLTIAGPLMGLFTSNPETIAIGQTALRVICLGFIVSAVSTTSSGALEGLGKGVPSLVISLCRYIIFIMPIAWVLCGRMGPTGVWHAFWITEALSAVIAYAVYHKAIHQK